MTAATAGRGPTSVELPETDAVLARAGGENFRVASVLFGRTAARHLRAIYGFARLVDELGDAVAGDRLAHLDEAERELERAYGVGGAPRHPRFRELAVTIRVCGLPREPFRRLIEANRRDQHHTDYASYEELVDYCALSANPVGELVLHVFGAATPRLIELSDAVCTGLQLVEHWQDVREDAANGRVYLPAEDRERYGVRVEDLLAATASPQLRRLLAFESDRARGLLAEGTQLVRALRGRARLAVAGYVGGGRAALDALDAADYEVLAATPRASGRQVLAATLRVLRGAR
jgi:squalene synthase HpnC